MLSFGFLEKREKIFFSYVGDLNALAIDDLVNGLPLPPEFGSIH